MSPPFFRLSFFCIGSGFAAGLIAALQGLNFGINFDGQQATWPETQGGRLG
jgi:hypothetical protein